MKKVFSTVMIVALLLSGFSAFANVGASSAIMPMLVTNEVPTLYGDSAPRFELKQTGDAFTITLEENVTTGYSWIYAITDNTHVKSTGENQMPSETGIPGAGGAHAFSFVVSGDGVSTIAFNYKRPWETEAIETLVILVYKKGDTVVIEEDGIVHALDVNHPELYTTGEAYYLEKLILSDVKIQQVNGITMVPLRSTLEAMGYKVTWNNETKSVEIQQGAQWTSIAIGSNAYFKNKMAPATLSAAPVILGSRAYVPAEFFAEILSKGTTIESGSIKFSGNEAVIHSGFVKVVTTDKLGNMTITLTSDLSSEDLMLQTIIHTTTESTLVHKKVVEGEQIHVISSMIMTMSIPGQTSGYIIY